MSSNSSKDGLGYMVLSAVVGSLILALVVYGALILLALGALILVLLVLNAGQVMLRHALARRPKALHRIELKIHTAGEPEADQVMPCLDDHALHPVPGWTYVTPGGYGWMSRRGMLSPSYSKTRDKAEKRLKKARTGS
ncbi:hypothetical protein ACFV9D_22930 [Streptomyces sp. NPDC059875]|uniref:hypothetical protein n=1 Tax=unclassified Streptomyces TaxID=2593676 RepID=UPI00365FBD14